MPVPQFGIFATDSHVMPRNSFEASAATVLKAISKPAMIAESEIHRVAVTSFTLVLICSLTIESVRRPSLVRRLV